MDNLKNELKIAFLTMWDERYSMLSVFLGLLAGLTLVGLVSILLEK